MNKSSISSVESAGLSYLFQEHWLNIMIPGGEGSILSTPLFISAQVRTPLFNSWVSRRVVGGLRDTLWPWMNI